MPVVWFTRLNASTAPGEGKSMDPTMALVAVSRTPMRAIVLPLFEAPK